MRQLILIICGFCAVSNYAQETREVNASINLEEVAMLDLEPNNSTVTLNLSSAIEAGEKVLIEESYNDKWINFSSAVFAGNSRSILIQMDLGQKAPSGINLKLRTENYTGSGKFYLDMEPSVVNVVTLNDQPQTIVSDIRGAFTGNGENNGYKITYELVIYDYKLLDFNQSASLSIILTLTDSI